MATTQHKYNNRFKRLLVQQVKCLSQTEHEEVFKIMNQKRVEHTRNKNGFFFNLSQIDDDVIQQIHNFVTFSLENKKHLDEYDKKIIECKINNNYSEIIPSQSTEPVVDNQSQSQTNEWNSLIQPYQNKIKDTFDAINHNITKGCKRKCSTKFNLAKKKFAKRATGDKKIDIEHESNLSFEPYPLA